MIKKRRKPTSPYFTYRKQKRPPRKYSITLLLILANVIVYFIVIALLGFYGEKIIYSVALQPSSALQKPWTFITSMFMHAPPPALFHIFVNMLSLFFLGSFLERLIGKKRFLILYIVTGLVGGLFFAFFSISPLNAIPGIGIANPETLAVGASGAIFGLGGILAVLTPRIPVYIMLIPIAMPLWLGITLMFAILVVITAIGDWPIGNAAHLGGLVAGLAYGFYLRFKYKKKIALLDKYFKFRR